jgi:hypothetical protein
MGIEFKDRRLEKAAAEATAPTVFAGGAENLLNPETEALAAEGSQVMPTGSHAVVEFKKTVRGEVQTFKSIGYTLVYLNLGNGQPMLAGRAVGLRTDEKMFTADWMLPPVWEEDTSWQVEAKKRLLTFKACSCDQRGRCAFHGEVCGGQLGPGKWIEEDMQRLRKVSTTPLCEALEVLMKAEAARQNAKIVTPGR